MRAELEAGSTYVIAEAREAGNVGIYRGSGEVREGLVNGFTQIPRRKNFVGSTSKEQQLYFLELLGCNANLEILHHGSYTAWNHACGLKRRYFHLYLNKETSGS